MLPVETKKLRSGASPKSALPVNNSAGMVLLKTSNLAAEKSDAFGKPFC
jgi:hypothetical protein